MDVDVKVGRGSLLHNLMFRNLGRFAPINLRPQVGGCAASCHISTFWRPGAPPPVLPFFGMGPLPLLHGCNGRAIAIDELALLNFKAGKN